MKRYRVVAALAALLSALVLPSPARGAGEDGEWRVAGGGDEFRSGYNSAEPPPYFVTSGVPAIQPNPEWSTKLSDLPSGVFLMGGLIVAEGKVIVGGGATNSLIALDQDTGLPVWRFQPDPRGSRFNPGDGSSGGYPYTNAPQYNDGVVYATFTNGTLYAIDAGTGNRLWRFEVPEAGAPGEVTDHTLPANVEWDQHNPQHTRFPLRREAAPFTGDYPKFGSAVGYCDGKVLAQTLDSRLFVLDATDGSMIWHRYIGAPDWPGEFVWTEYERGGIVPSSGRSTRRFEATPGTGCHRSTWMVSAVEDGFVKVFDADTGAFVNAYDAHHEGDSGFAHDIGAGNADPRSGDLIVNTLSNRMIRLSVPKLRPRWQHTEDAGQLSLCSDRATRTNCNVLVTSNDVRQDGPIGGGVFGGNLAIDTNRRVIVNPNQDGHLYIFRNIDAEDENPKLVAKVATAKNPLSKKDPDPDTVSYYLPNDGKNGPWVHRTAVLSSPVLGGGVAYFNASWEHAIYGVQYLSGKEILDDPRIVFKYTVQWDDQFPYPPFGDTYAEPIVDIDLLTFGSPALVDGHLYTQANDGTIYSFNLRQPVADTTRNLAILGSGMVPFLPKYTEASGSFDRVWTTADWYKNQVAPEGFRLPSPGTLVPALGLPVAAFGLWARRASRRRKITAFTAAAATPWAPPSLPQGREGPPTPLPHGSRSLRSLRSAGTPRPSRRGPTANASRRRSPKEGYWWP